MESAETVSTVELSIQGMHCQSCVLLIEETLDRDPAVYTVSVDLDLAQASVTFDPGSTSVGAVCATVTNLGYQAAPAG
jgi:copper chaperone CopZ